MINAPNSQEEIAVLKEHFQTLKERVTAARKQSMDTKIVDIMLMNVMPKIMMANSSGDKKDFEAVKRLLAEIENEMKQLMIEERFEDALKLVAEQERQRLVKQDTTLKEGKLDQNEIIDKTNNLIKQANEYLVKKDFEKVFVVYLQIQGIYKYLPKELKEEVYKDSIAIYNQLKQSGVFRSKSKWQLFLRRLGRRLRT